MKRTKWLAVFMAAMAAAAITSGCGKDGTRETAQMSAAAPTESSVQAAKETRDETEKTTGAESQDHGGGEDSGQEAEVYSRKPDAPAKDGDKFLFVGNSHTYTNDLPGVFYEMAQAGGHDVEVYDLTEGSYTLEWFSDPEDEIGAVLIEALQGEHWDFVVLQENTNAAISINAKEDMYPYARKLDQMIGAAGGQTAFLMTWAPEEGAGVFSREAVQAMLSNGYQTIAKELDALMIPGGNIFLEALNQDGNLTLLGEDGQHPSEEGTYLAACAAYALFFQETPVGNPFLFDLDEDTAAELQQIAQEYMLDQEESGET